MPNILIVEDELPMLNGLRDNLEFEGYQVDTASDGQTGYEKISTGHYDLVLLDVMLPKLSGFDICKLVRSQGVVTPIMLLTAKGEELDKVRGLEYGADDYVVKPFSLRELLARVKAMLRRSKATAAANGSNMLTIGRITVDFDSYEATCDGDPCKLSHKEFEVLNYLYKHKNQVVHRDDLLKDIWDIDFNITTRTVDNFILRLRNKIETDPKQPKVILTVHGIGYKMIWV
ncbi:MAG: response regulator transcription factor [Bacteroidales bacterium]|nr:response regulator transcription factor [Bacteroidales bacterium]